MDRRIAQVLSDSLPEVDFQLLFQVVPSVCLVLTPELHIVAATDAYLTATMTTREQIVGRYVFDVFPENPADAASEGLNNVLASFRRVLETRKVDAMPVFKYDIRRPESEGSLFEERHWSVVNYPVLDDDGNILYIMNRVEDVTEFVRVSKLHRDEIRAHEELKLQTKELETELFTQLRERDGANQRLRELNCDLETFASTVSHDLQAPLRRLRGFAKILLDEHGHNLDELGKEHLKTIMDSGAQMSTLIHDLLTYGRVSSREILFEPVSLAVVVAAVIRQLPENEEIRRLRIDIPPALPQMIAHLPTLTQVILNLLWNAKKFVQPGRKAELTIAAEEVGKKTVRVWIRDRGIGIAPQHLERIFKPFERLHAMDHYPGSGIGLAIVKRGVERMNGRVGVESRIGEGSSFWIELPVA